MAVGIVTVLIIGLALMRPGWTMTRDRHEALYFGTLLIRGYQRANEPRKAEIRRVLHLRDAAETPTTMRPPSP